MNEIVFEKIRALYYLAKEKSAYYNLLYKNYPPDLTHDVFYSLPFVSSSIYSEKIGNISTHSKFEEVYAFTTGGTTEKPKYVYITYADLHENIKYHGYAYKQAGIQKNDRVAVFGKPGMLTSEFTVYLGLEKCKSFILPIGEYENLGNVILLLKEFNINALIVMPSDLVKLVDYCIEKNIMLTLDKVITGGEPLYPSVEDYIKKNMSMDFGTVGYKKKDCRRDEYYIQTQLQYIEVIKNDRGDHAEEGETGELIVTNLARRLIPIIRYKTGDIVTVLNKEKTKIKINGRCSEDIKLGGEKFQIDNKIYGGYI